jgi:hypothetical protein
MGSFHATELRTIAGYAARARLAHRPGLSGHVVN